MTRWSPGPPEADAKRSIPWRYSAPRRPPRAARSHRRGRSPAREGPALRLPRDRHLRDRRARPSAPATTSTASTPGSSASSRRTSRRSSSPRRRCADGFVSPELRLAVIPFRRLVHRRRAAAPAPARARLASFADLRVGDFVVHDRPRHRPLRRLRDQDGRRGHPRLPRARVPRRGQGLRAHRPAREDHPLHRRRRRRPAALRARIEALGRGQGARAPRGPRPRRRAAEPLRRAPGAQGPRLRARRRVAAGARALVPLPRDRRPGRRDRGRRRPTWSPSGRWTG